MLIDAKVYGLTYGDREENPQKVYDYGNEYDAKMLIKYLPSFVLDALGEERVRQIINK